MWGLIPTFGKEGRKQPLISKEDLTIARLSQRLSQRAKKECAGHWSECRGSGGCLRDSEKGDWKQEESGDRDLESAIC